MSDNSWQPTVRAIRPPAIVGERGPEIVQHINVMPAAAVVPPVVKVAAKTIAPNGWSFIPYRDEQNLIVEIIAKPIT